MSLIDDLKAAHEAASAQLSEADFHSAGWHRRNAASERLDTLMRLHAGEIIEALEDRERMREVVEAARILLGDSGFLDPEYSSDMYPDEYHALSHALDALEKP